MPAAPKDIERQLITIFKMKDRISILCTAAIAGTMLQAHAAEPVEPKTKVRPDRTLLLYPEGQKSDRGIEENGKAVTLGPLKSNGITSPEAINDFGDLKNISDSARIDLYFPKKPNGQMVVVTPGGGYGYVSSFNEGAYVADWFLKQNITVCVVKYRMPNGHWEIPLTDVQNAFRYCRAHAGEWKVNQIGIIGFSAGGHLAASASTLFTDETTRPDFSILVYPVITMDLSLTHKGTHDRLIGKESKWLDKNQTVDHYEIRKSKYDELMKHYSLQNDVTPQTPPTVLFLSTDDKTVPPENSIMYYEALKANKVQAQMYIYPYGGHGWGFTSSEFGNDKIAAYRPLFFETLKTWLAELNR